MWTAVRQNPVNNYNYRFEHLIKDIFTFRGKNCLCTPILKMKVCQFHKLILTSNYDHLTSPKVNHADSIWVFYELKISLPQLN